MGPRRSRTKEWTYAISTIVISVTKNRLSISSVECSLSRFVAGRFIGEHFGLDLIHEDRNARQLGRSWSATQPHCARAASHCPRRTRWC